MSVFQTECGARRASPPIGGGNGMNHLRPRLASETPYTRLFLMPKVFLDILICIMEVEIGHLVTNRNTSEMLEKRILCGLEMNYYSLYVNVLLFQKSS